MSAVIKGERERAEQRVRSALTEADTSVLALVYVHLTGDERLLDEIAPFVKSAWAHEAAFPPQLEERVRDLLVPLLVEPRSDLPPVPEPRLLRRMMSVAVGQEVPDEYAAMMGEQVSFSEETVRKGGWRRRPDESTRRAFHVAIVGAGMSGICMAIRLKWAGIPFTIYEKNPTVGGTWFENRYPGCGVDTPNHYYCFSFEPYHDWPHYYSKRDELWGYFERCADKYGLRDSIRFDTEVLSTHYDAERARWKVTTRHRDEAPRTQESNAVVFAVGQLNRPLIPDIPGLDAFAGPVVHTAQWPDRLELRGRRVAMIGTGASGMQVGPTIAPEVERLVIFQRSPHWASPTPNYHRRVEDGKKWALHNVPFYANWYRFQLFWGSSDSVHPMLQVDPHWTKPEQSLNAANEALRQRLVEYIRGEVGGDPELLAKCVPPYPPYGKRMLRDNHWYRTLTRDNVELVSQKVARVTPHSVVAEDGTHHDADVIVLATGFRAAEQLAPMDIRGRGGVSIREVWGQDDPRAYLGITVPGFPNMFVMYGPNTNIAHGGSAIFHAECQVRYAMHGLRELIEAGHASMECRQDVHDAYNARVDEAHSRMVWAHKGVTNWYKNARGRVTQTTPWRQVDYWKWTAELNPEDYIWR